MTFKRFGKGKVTANLSSAERKAIHAAADEFIRNEVLYNDYCFSREYDAIWLWTLHNELGFGKERLHRIWIAANERHHELREHWQLKEGESGFACIEALSRIGVDMHDWSKEINTVFIENGKAISVEQFLQHREDRLNNVKTANT